jgi:hypothetical protein
MGSKRKFEDFMDFSVPALVPANILSEVCKYSRIEPDGAPPNFQFFIVLCLLYIGLSRGKYRLKNSNPVRNPDGLTFKHLKCKSTAAVRARLNKSIDSHVRIHFEDNKKCECNEGEEQVYIHVQSEQRMQSLPKILPSSQRHP